MPRVITLDAYAASHRAIRELKSEGHMSSRVRTRSSKYLNNVVEQDHRRVKQRVGPMLGFKRFDTATITISGIELAEKIKKAQFKIGRLFLLLGGAIYTGIGVGVGVGIDVLIQSNQTIYRSQNRTVSRIHLAPVFSSQRKGVSVSLSF